MKSIRKENFKTAKDKINCKIERTILEKLKSPFVVQLHYAFQTPDKVYFIVDYMHGGDLFLHLRKDHKFKESRAKFYIAQWILALKDMHKLGIIYRDLKLENIMLDKDGNIKLTDFGLSKLGIKNNQDKAYSFVGTPEYLAPEIIKGSGHSHQADWWSLGAIFYEMITGVSPFYNKNIEKTLDNILSKDIKIPGFVSKKAKSLILGLLERSPNRRLGATKIDDILNHEFFNDIDWKAMKNKDLKPPYRPKTLGDAWVKYFSQEFVTQDPTDSLVNSALTLDQKKENHFEQFTYHKEDQILMSPSNEIDVSQTYKNSIIWEMEESGETGKL